MSEVHALPVGARLIHVGPPKTGTTAVQSGFHRNRGRLLDLGVHYAGQRQRPRAATGELIYRKRDRRHWEALVAEVAGSTATRVCISSETFAVADDAQAREVVRALGGKDAWVVMVIRPLDALLPSHWQQRVRRLPGTVSFEEWLEEVLADDGTTRAYRDFWHLRDVAAQTARWASAADGRLKLIVSREGDREYLPRVFEGLLDLPSGALDTQGARDNSSYSLNAIEMLRAVDREAAGRPWGEWYREHHRPLVAKALQGRRSGLEEVAIPGRFVPRIAELNDQLADAVVASGAEVIGDVDELRGREIRHVEQAPAVSVPLDLAAQVLAESIGVMRRRQARLEKRVTRLESRLAEARRAGKQPRGGRDQDRLDRAYRRARAVAGRLRRRFTGR